MKDLQELDHDIFLFLNNLGSETWDPIWIIITTKWYSIPLYVILLILVFKKFGVKGTLLVMVLVALMITCTDQLANVFKHGFQRARPCGQDGVRELARFVAERCGRFGYFSAHAASSMAVAVFVGLLLRSKYYYLIFILLLWAAIIGYSRIYVGVHYPGDILTGMTIGALIGFLYYKLHGYLLPKLIRNKN